MSNPSNMNSTPIPNKLESGKNRERIFQEFLVLAAVNATVDNPALLYKGVHNSPYQQEINNYPFRLKDQQNLVELLFQPYPKVGELPQIYSQGL